MHYLCDTPGRIATGVLLAAILSQAQSGPKKVKDNGEYELYGNAVKDAADPAKAIEDLDLWAQKYPDSDFKDDRWYMYMQACSRMNPPQSARILEYGSKLMSRDLQAIFSGPAGSEQLAGQPIRLAMTNVLFQVAMNAASVPDASVEQLALGEKAARQLLEIAPKYFTPENRPANTSEAQWAQARADVENKVRLAQIGLELKPALAAQQKKDCSAQEAAFGKAYFNHPDSGVVAYQSGVALITCFVENPEKLARGLWRVARAAAMDPAKSGMEAGDRAGIQSYLQKVYVKIHGSEEGLDALKRQAAGSPDPPPGFTVRSAADIAQARQAELERDNPQLAMWIIIKAALVEAHGEQYFAGQLKNAAVPQLWGKLMEARPACRPRELLVSVPVPDAPGPPSAEIALRLEKPLSGKPEVDSELRFDAVPSAFTREPFLLTMDTSAERIKGLRTTPCGPGVSGSGVNAKTAAKKR